MDETVILPESEDYSSLQSQLLEEQLILEVSARCAPFLNYAGDEKEAVREFAAMWRKCLKGEVVRSEAIASEDERERSTSLAHSVPSMKSSLISWSEKGYGTQHSIFFPTGGRAGVPEPTLPLPGVRKVQSQTQTQTRVKDDSMETRAKEGDKKVVGRSVELDYGIDMSAVVTGTAAPPSSSSSSSSSSTRRVNRIPQKHGTNDDAKSLDDAYVRYLGYPFIGLTVLHSGRKAQVVQIVKEEKEKRGSKMLAPEEVRLRYHMGAEEAEAAAKVGALEATVPWCSAQISHEDMSWEEYQVFVTQECSDGTGDVAETRQQSREDASSRRVSLAVLALGVDSDDEEEGEGAGAGDKYDVGTGTDVDSDNDDFYGARGPAAAKRRKVETISQSSSSSSTARDPSSLPGPYSSDVDGLIAEGQGGGGGPDHGLEIVFWRSYQHDYAKMLAKRWAACHGTFSAAQAAFLAGLSDNESARQKHGNNRGGGAASEGEGRQGTDPEQLSEDQKQQLLGMVEAMDVRPADLRLLSRRVAAAEARLRVLSQRYARAEEEEECSSSSSSSSSSLGRGQGQAVKLVLQQPSRAVAAPAVAPAHGRGPAGAESHSEESDIDRDRDRDRDGEANATLRDDTDLSMPLPQPGRPSNPNPVAAPFVVGCAPLVPFRAGQRSMRFRLRKAVLVTCEEGKGGAESEGARYLEEMEVVLDTGRFAS